MKNVVKNVLWGALIAWLTAGCSSDDAASPGEGIIVDYAPVVISVKVLSPEGYSILNEQNTQSISAVYGGTTYECQEEQPVWQCFTRVYVPNFYGLIHQNDYLLFGELDGARNYDNEQLILQWGGDLKPDTITFSRRLVTEFSERGNFWTYTSLLLNGQPVTDQITIYKDLPTYTEEVNDSTPPKQMPIKDEWRELISGVNRFGVKLFQQMVQEKQTESLVASPLSVAYLLGMVANGAPETSMTLIEIDNALRQREKKENPSISVEGCYLASAQPFNELFETLIEWAPQVDNRVQLELADALFTDTNFPVYAGFVKMLAQYYHADYAQLDFDSEDAVKTINAWSNQKTHGLIPSIIGQIPGNAVAYLFNALYFKAPWMVPFKMEDTREETFTLPDGTTTMKPLMHNLLYTFAAQGENYMAVSLPFGKGAYWMDFYLPTEGVSTAQLAQELDFQNIPWIPSEVTLTLPRFEVTSDHKSLNNFLQNLGVNKIFTPAAEFSGLSPVDGLCISRIFQKARIIINEEGGEAAAVSGVEFVTSCTPKVTFTANRPFLYCIREASSGAIFFLGTFCGDEQQ